YPLSLFCMGWAQPKLSRERTLVISLMVQHDPAESFSSLHSAVRISCRFERKYFVDYRCRELTASDKVHQAAKISWTTHRRSEEIVLTKVESTELELCGFLHIC